MKKLNKTARSATKSLEKFLAEMIQKGDPRNRIPKVNVYTFKQKGLRIAEIDVTYKNKTSTGGWAWQRSQYPEIILACEDFLIYLDTKPEDDGYSPYLEAIEAIEGFVS